MFGDARKMAASWLWGCSKGKSSSQVAVYIDDCQDGPVDIKHLIVSLWPLTAKF